MSTENLGIIVAGVVAALGLLCYFARNIEIIARKESGDEKSEVIVRMK